MTVDTPEELRKLGRRAFFEAKRAEKQQRSAGDIPFRAEVMKRALDLMFAEVKAHYEDSALIASAHSDYFRGYCDGHLNGCNCSLFEMYRMPRGDDDAAVRDWDGYIREFKRVAKPRVRVVARMGPVGTPTPTSQATIGGEDEPS